VNTFIRDVQITGDSATGDVYIAGMNEGGGGTAGPRSNKIYRSTDGGVTWTNTYTGPNFTGPSDNTTCSSNSYFAAMFSGYWRHMGWGEPAALNHTVHYVYAQHGAGADPGDVYYIRSTDSGVTFSAPLKLNTDATTRPQWQPNLSVSPGGSLFAVWYDARESASCQKGNPGVPCYRMWGRKSTDNGVTWLADMTFSDVVTPLPAQPDASIVACYAGDYDYGSATTTKHVTSWVDGRVPINNASQQDAFSDNEPAAGGTPTPTPTATPSATPTATPTATPSATPTATPGQIQLRGQKKKVNGMNTVRLNWTGATSAAVDVYRNDVLIATTPNAPPFLYTDFTGDTGRAQYTYRVCEAGTAACSNDLRVRFQE
jgi:hypothetical protein